MHKQQPTFLPRSIKPIQESKTLDIPGIIHFLKLFPGPENGSLGTDIKTFRVAKGTHVVITEQADFGMLHHQIKAFTWIRAVANHITQTINRVDSLRPDIRQNNLKRFKVTVDVANDCATQRRGSSFILQ